MAARPLRRAICAGAKKGTAVAPAVVALRTILPRYVLPLPRFCYKRDLDAYYGHAKAILSVRAVLLRALLLLRLVGFALPSSYIARVWLPSYGGASNVAFRRASKILKRNFKKSEQILKENFN